MIALVRDKHGGAIWVSGELMEHLLEVIKRGLNTYPDTKARDQVADSLFPMSDKGR